MAIDDTLRVFIYRGTTLVADPTGDMEFPEVLSFTTQFPGGDFGDASFFINKPITSPIQWRGEDRVVITNGQTTVYEGYIKAINRIYSTDTEGFEVLCYGAVEKLLMKGPLEKWWADNRLTDDVWTFPQGAGLEVEDWDIDRQARIHLAPRPGTFGTADYIALRHVQPIGRNSRRIYYTYDFSEKAGQSWKMSLYRSTDASAWTEIAGTAAGDSYTVGTSTVISATGTGTIDVTLGTVSRYVETRLTAMATNVAADRDHTHAQMSNVMVYSAATIPVTMESVVEDVTVNLLGALSGIVSQDASLIETAGTPKTVEPFVTSGYPNCADIFDDIVGRGDGAYNRWAWGVKESLGDSLPIVFLKQYPALDDYEYVLSLGDENISGDIQLAQDFDAIINSIIISYTDPNGMFQYSSPDVDGNLQDTQSLTDWGIHGIRLDCGQTTSAEAAAYARRILATYKDPQYKLLSSPNILNYIVTKNGEHVHVSQVRAGERIKLLNFLDALSGVNPIFVITATSYDYDDDELTITCGVPGAPIGARQIPRLVSPPPDDATGSVSSDASGIGGGGKRGVKGRDTNWRKRKYVTQYAKRMGIDLSKVPGRSKERDKIVKDAWKNREKRKP